MGRSIDLGLGGVFVGLGANLGDPASSIRAALVALDRDPELRLLRASALYLAPAWGPIAQSDFVNAAAEIATALEPEALVTRLLAIERGLGRERGADRWGPRAIDLDLLVHRNICVDRPGCRVPHPHLAERAFALVPLAEIAADVDVPGLRTIGELLARLPAAELSAIRRL